MNQATASMTHEQFDKDWLNSRRIHLKMADEQTKPPYNRPARIPKDLDWASLERLAAR